MKRTMNRKISGKKIYFDKLPVIKRFNPDENLTVYQRAEIKLSSGIYELVYLAGKTVKNYVVSDNVAWSRGGDGRYIKTNNMMTIERDKIITCNPIDSGKLMVGLISMYSLPEISPRRGTMSPNPKVFTRAEIYLPYGEIYSLIYLAGISQSGDLIHGKTAVRKGSELYLNDFRKIKSDRIKDLRFFKPRLEYIAGEDMADGEIPKPRLELIVGGR